MVVAIAIIWFRLLASVRFVTSLPVQSWLFIVFFFFFFNFISDSCGQEAKPTIVTSPVEGKKNKTGHHSISFNRQLWNSLMTV